MYVCICLNISLKSEFEKKNKRDEKERKEYFSKYSTKPNPVLILIRVLLIMFLPVKKITFERAGDEIPFEGGGRTGNDDKRPSAAGLGTLFYCF